MIYQKTLNSPHLCGDDPERDHVFPNNTFNKHLLFPIHMGVILEIQLYIPHVHGAAACMNFFHFCMHAAETDYARALFQKKEAKLPLFVEA